MPRGVYIRSQEYLLYLKTNCSKLGKLTKGKSAWNKGKKTGAMSDKDKLTHSVAAKKFGVGKWMKGKKLSEETKKKISKNHSKHFIGKTHTEESKQKNRKSHKGIKSSLWKGGISENRKEYYRFKCLERIARKKQAEGNHTIKEWEELKNKYNFRCVHCFRKEPDIKLTEDHIIPLSKNGTNFISNIQPLCKSCNSKKGSKIL